MAVFCDFENVALGVRDANYEKFDIKPILERLLLKGSIVVKKAYCDWDRYKSFKATMHEANFELIEIPHVRQSGKNSADIRLVVDALDLCYTKSHVNTFVIISGDSDFSPLVSKLRENAKQVIGVGVKQSTSDLLVANCDEFIFYDDLVRESRRTAAKREAPAAAVKRTPDEEKHRKEKYESRKTQAIEMAVETFDALVSERGDSGKIWASMLKEAIKRRKPDFSESYYGFRTFGNLLEEAQARGLLEFGRDEKSGAYVYRSSNAPGVIDAMAEQSAEAPLALESADVAEAHEPGNSIAQANTGAQGNAGGQGKRESRRNGRGGRKSADGGRNERGAGNGQRGRGAPVPAGGLEQPAESMLAFDREQEQLEQEPERELHAGDAQPAAAQREPRRNGRGGRNEKSSNGGRGKSAPTFEPVFDIEHVVEAVDAIEDEVDVAVEAAVEVAAAQREPRRNERGGRKQKSGANGNRNRAEAPLVEAAPEAPVAVPEVLEVVAPEPVAEPAVAEEKPAAKARAPRKTATRKPKSDVVPEVPVSQAAADETPAKSADKPAARARRSRKADATPDGV
ncbi:MULTISPECIES: NYN domain-containing protein [unclassified Janthinobacterium]|uniref:NYN domain-containing protein n=1 Tax=unclassified Janthinobacterium TaxID=2610881 RepID=UPI00034A35EA|nr:MULTISPECIES: NYN domain-containing protein [unclassified Janthinobacterium]MEC5160476.1 uncharacterized LabA/DUF88 family protein [Janthinobacterium sp. CG_S6]